MATMKRLMVECGSPVVAEPYQSHNQRMMNHHSGKAMEMGRMARNHSLHGEDGIDDSVSGQHKALAAAYGAAAKAHLSLADHHGNQFKKERTDTVKDMTTTPKKIKALK